MQTPEEPLVTKSKYFLFRLILNFNPISALGANPFFVEIRGIINRKKFKPTRKYNLYKFETCEFAELFFKAVSIYPPSKNLKEYGTEGEEAWYHFDRIFDSVRQQEHTKYGI